MFIGIGCNLGTQDEMLERMRRSVELMESSGISVLRRSTVYRTSPWGVTDQPDFLNAVIMAEADECPTDILLKLKHIEEKLGRTPGERWGPREMDLDILLIEDREIDEPILTVPHLHLLDREFAWGPLLEIAPDATLPDQRPVDSLVDTGCASMLEPVATL